MNNTIRMVFAAVILVAGFAAGASLIAAASSGAYVGRFAEPKPVAEMSCVLQDGLPLVAGQGASCARPDADWINCASGGDCEGIAGGSGLGRPRGRQWETGTSTAGPASQ